MRKGNSQHLRKVDLNDPRPPYRQVADALRSDIRTGVLGPGKKLPKQPSLAESFGVSLGTVKAALGVLRDESLITSRQGEGAWVCRELPEPPVEAGSARNSTERALAEMGDQLTMISERLARIEKRLDRH